MLMIIEPAREAGGGRLGQNKQVQSRLHNIRVLCRTHCTGKHTGRGAGAAACIGTIGMALARKTNYSTQPPISTPILRHIGITTDVRKGRFLDGLCIIPPRPAADTQIIAHQVQCGETCWLGPEPRKGSPEKELTVIYSSLFHQCALG